MLRPDKKLVIHQVLKYHPLNGGPEPKQINNL